MVTTDLAGGVARPRIEQERTGTPSTWTVQAPHGRDAAAEFRPDDVEVLAQDPEQRLVGSASTWRGWPLTVSEIIVR